ncbi:MAG: hypothetical protein J7521_07725 [Caulobacter sp.]|nr:hypothetical protein [Caulobacter sp.]
MRHAHAIDALSLNVVEIDGLIGDPGYLEALPCVHHVEAGREGRLVVWFENPEDDGPSLEDQQPARSPDVELHGQGAPRQALLGHPRAQHVEMFFDGLGDPDVAPLGWWHARIWLRSKA